MPTDVLAPHRPTLEKALQELQDHREQLLLKATSDVDSKIKSLQILLELSPSSDSNGGSGAHKVQETELTTPVTTPVAAQVVSQTETQSKVAKASKTRTPKKFNANDTLKEFKNLELKDAIRQFLDRQPDQAFDVPTIVVGLYGEFNEVEQKAAIRALSITVAAVARRGECLKVSDRPKTYQSKAN